MDSPGHSDVASRSRKLSQKLVCRYAVTYEFDTRPPLTHRSTVAGSNDAVCVYRATKEARKALHPVGWTSLVVVLLERLPPEQEQAS